MKQHILIIDDDRAVRDAFELALGDDYEVALADGGLQGIEFVQARRPEMVFLDLKMPGIDGVDTLREIKRIDPTIPVYIVTAFAMEFMERLAGAKEEGLRFEIASKPLGTEQIRLIARSRFGDRDN